MHFVVADRLFVRKKEIKAGREVKYKTDIGYTYCDRRKRNEVVFIAQIY